MSIDYGSRIRAVCDYLETVPGDKYDFNPAPWQSLENGGCGCIVYHGYAGGLIPEAEAFGHLFPYQPGMEWLLGSAEMFEKTICSGCGATGKGEAAKQAAINALRAYADKHYPYDKPKHTGLPDVVRDLFRIGAAA